jgi:hypothetical protein
MKIETSNHAEVDICAKRINDKLRNLAIVIFTIGLIMEFTVYFVIPDITKNNLYRSTINVISVFIELLIWFYLSIILIQFYRLTHLKELILSNYTFWLSGILSVGVGNILYGVNLLIEHLFGYSLHNILGWFGFLWPALYLIGLFLRRYRAIELINEKDNHTDLLKMLASLDYKDIMLLRFLKS